MRDNKTRGESTKKRNCGRRKQKKIGRLEEEEERVLVVGTMVRGRMKKTKKKKKEIGSKKDRARIRGSSVLVERSAFLQYVSPHFLHR